MKKLIAILIVVALATPLIGLLSVAVLLNPSAISCGTGSLVVGGVPDSLTARTRDGRSIVLNHQQLSHAATIVTTGARTPNTGRQGVLIALIAALTESTLRMLANTSAYPESADYPNDGVGSDHDSLGLFQMRPASGWGTVAELMNAEYQARAFFGGPLGPNAGSPRGLLDIAGWQQMGPGEAAQAVEVSAYPDRYQNYQPVAEAILAALTRTTSGTPDGVTPIAPETSRVVFPLPAGTYTVFRSFGWRIDPFSGSAEFHRGSDLSAPLGTPILAVADGVVTFAGQRSPHGGQIIIEHTVDGERVASYYHHMYDDGMHVTTGESVTAGQHIGDVGSAGRSTGPHLHIEIHPGGASKPAVDAMQWLAAHAAVGVEGAEVATALCTASGRAD